MKPRVISTVTRSVPAAIVLSLVLAGQSMAATWATPVPLTAAAAGFDGDIVAFGSSTAVAAYVESNGSDELFIRRTTNSGATWAPPLLISADGTSPALAARDSMVDIVWNPPNGRVRYSRSLDAGVSFEPSIALSPLGRFAWRPAVARGPGGLVAVVYEDVQNGNVAVRVSQNGGMSFGAASILTGDGGEMGLAAAIGNGVIYVAYSVGFESLRLKRSTNEGASWSGPASISNQLWDDGISMAAVGSHAYVAYTAQNTFPQFGKIRYKRTTNSGANWSAQLDLSPSSWSTFDPDIHLRGGVLRSVFTRCTPEFDICVEERTLYSQSANGTTWTAPQRVSPTTLWAAYSPRVGFAGRILAFYLGDDATGLRPFVRRGTP